MASVRHRQRGNGTIAWQVLYRLDDRQRSLTFDQEDHALQAQRLFDALGPTEALAALRGITPGDETPTLERWCRDYIDDKSGITPGTRESYRGQLDRHLGPIGALPLTMLTHARMSRWIRDLEETGLGQATINGIRFILSGALEAAVREGLIPSNPIRGVRVAKTEHRSPTFLTPDEFGVLLRHIRPDAKDLVLALAGTGMRFGEATALQVRDLDLTNKQVSIARAWKASRSSTQLLGAPKSDRSRRTIWVDDITAAALARAAAGKRRDEFVFTTAKGKQWRRNGFHDNVWQPAIAVANGEPPKWTIAEAPTSRRPWLAIPPADERLGKRPTVHDLRHTCASWMIQDGQPLPVVQRHLGHSSIRITADTYGHLLPEHMAAPAASIGKRLAGLQ